MIRLPENFESYAEARKNGFLKMKEPKYACVLMTRASGRYAGAIGTALIGAKQTGERICL